MDITLNSNGSGNIALEYHISKSLDSLGKLDGNERWNTIPAGRADFERSLNRLPEMKLLSFSSKENEKDLIIAAKMEFKTIQGLLDFLDAGGRRSSFSGNEKSGRITLTLAKAAEGKSPALYKLLEEISESYSVRMAMSFPAGGNLAVTDGQGRALAPVPGTEVQASGKKVFFSFPLYEVLSSTDGINVEFSW